MSRRNHKTDARHQCDLGTGFAQRGSFDVAEAHYRRAITLDKDCADAHNNLGNVFRIRGDIHNAVACFERAVSINPDFVIAQNNLGVVLRETKRLEEAKTHLRRALSLNPHYTEAYFNLGNVFSDEGDLNAASESYTRTISLAPGFAQAHLNLGNVFRIQGNFNEALECYQRAIMHQPNYAEAHYNSGNILFQQDRLEDAMSCYQRAITVNPRHSEAFLNLGMVLNRQAKHKDALAYFRQALALNPDYAEAHLNAALVNLCLGNFSEAWPEYEWRWHVGYMKGSKIPPMPIWNWSSLQGKTILLYCEQGRGDSLQFIRYAAKVKESGARVFLLCPQPLARLFGCIKEIEHVFVEGSLVPPCDYCAPLMSLPLFFNTGLDTIPNSVPYLFALPEHVADWANRLRAFSGLKVGLVWAGDSRAGNELATAMDRRRSIRLEQFAPLAKGGGSMTFFSLQKGPPAEQIKDQASGLDIIDFMDSVQDFADTAAFVANLDLIISVDTSVVHLAGALGKPVWVLSRFDGCWRWLLEREDSPWYPSLRIFRQKQAGDWDSVIDSVSVELTHYVNDYFSTKRT